MTKADYVCKDTATKLNGDGTFSLPFSSELRTGEIKYVTLQPRDAESSQFVQAFRTLIGQVIENVPSIDVTCIAEEKLGNESYVLQLQHIGTDKKVALRVIYGGNQFSAKAVMGENQKISREGGIGEVVNRMIAHLEGAVKQPKTKRIKRPYAGAVEYDDGHGQFESQFED